MGNFQSVKSKGQGTGEDTYLRDLKGLFLLRD